MYYFNDGPWIPSDSSLESKMIRILLIGGTSHSGKSTVGKAVAEKLGWRLESTDYLARHPGRPWRTDGSEVPPHVIEHFSTLTVDELMAEVLRHYRTVWPQIEALMAENEDGLVIEGSAVLPELVAELQSDRVKRMWLVGSDGLFRSRIEAESRLAPASACEALAIEKFALRAERFNRYVKAEVERLGLSSLPADAPTAILVERLISQLI
jgi:2-phosphoglycerate kinase